MNSALFSWYYLGDGPLGPGESDKTLNTTNSGHTREDGIFHSVEAGSPQGVARCCKRVLSSPNSCFFNNLVPDPYDARFCTTPAYVSFDGQIAKKFASAEWGVSQAVPECPKYRKKKIAKVSLFKITSNDSIYKLKGFNTLNPSFICIIH